MKVLLSSLCGILFLAGATTSLAGVACQKCTHDLQVQYRKCRQSKDQETCSKEQQAAAQACVEICQKNKAPDEK